MGPNIITNEERVALKEMYNDRYSHGGYYLYEADAEEALALAEMEAADNYAHGGYYIHEAVEKEASEEAAALADCMGDENVHGSEYLLAEEAEEAAAIAECDSDVFAHGGYFLHEKLARAVNATDKDKEKRALAEMYADKYSHGGYYLHLNEAEEALAMKEMEGDKQMHGGYFIQETVEMETAEEIAALAECTRESRSVSFHGGDYLVVVEEAEEAAAVEEMLSAKHVHGSFYFDEHEKKKAEIATMALHEQEKARAVIAVASFASGGWLNSDVDSTAAADDEMFFDIDEAENVTIQATCNQLAEATSFDELALRNSLKAAGISSEALTPDEVVEGDGESGEKEGKLSRSPSSVMLADLSAMC